jgi:hypothetical protein
MDRRLSLKFAFFLIIPALLTACGDDTEEDGAVCEDGAATISGVLLDPDGNPVSYELEFIPASEEGDGDGDDEAVTARTAYSSSFTVTPGDDGRFSVEVEPGEWFIEGSWTGRPPEGDGCEVWEEVFAEYCGAHEVTLEFECYWLD